MKRKIRGIKKEEIQIIEEKLGLHDCGRRNY
jgi:hypothetical protein